MKARPWHIVIGLLLVIVLAGEVVKQLMGMGVR